MKTSTDIRDEIFNILKKSSLAHEVKHYISKTKRHANSKDEEIVIAVLANNCSQLQSAVINVNIYVPDISINGAYEEDYCRLRHLAKIASDVLCVNYVNDAAIFLQEQTIFDVRGSSEHCINNKLMYKYLNV